MTISKKINIGIIGIGRWGKVLLKEFKNKALTSQTSNSDVETNKLIKNSKIKAVVIATPIDTHYQIAKKALELNKHLFVEKPLSVYKSEIKEIEKLSIYKKLVVQTDYIFLYHPLFVYLQKLFKKKQILSVDCIWNKFGTFGNDIFKNLVVHDLAIIITLLGEITSVELYSKRNKIIAKLIHQNGLRSTIYINRRSVTKEKKIIVKTTDGDEYVWKNDDLFIQNKTGNYTKIKSFGQKTSLQNSISTFIKKVEIGDYKSNNFNLDLEIADFFEKYLSRKS